jgi:alpha-glucosidase (family GH31 glycosyl hydrolase)
MPYTYTLAYEARTTGMPLMRAMWLHYPDDARVRGMGSQYLWGRDLLIAPVFEKGATSRKVIIPPGRWRADDGTEAEGPAEITVNAPLSRLPHFKRIIKGE